MSKRKKISVPQNYVFILGILNLIYYLLDIYNIWFFLKKPAWMLWYSSVGLGLTSVGLIINNSFLLSVMFCSLFAVELLWSIGFLTILLFNIHIPGVAEYAFEANFPKKDFYITLFHGFLIPSLLIGLFKAKKIYSDAWIGSSLLSIILGVLSYRLVDNNDNVNCVHRLTYCRSLLLFLGGIENPLRIFIGVILLTIFVYIPTNYFLIKFGKKFKFTITDIHLAEKLKNYFSVFNHWFYYLD